MNTKERAETVEAFGSVTSDAVIEAINAAAALRDDLPDGFFKLPVTERLTILGLTGPDERN